MSKKIIIAVVVAAAAACGAYALLHTGGSGTSTGEVEYALSDGYVGIRAYTGLGVERTEAEEVTDADVEEYIHTECGDGVKTEYVDGEIGEGDTVELSYSGTVDGEAFEGGDDENATVTVGSGDYWPAEGGYAGFEEQLIGHKEGDEFDAEVMFAEGSQYEGEVATFHVKVMAAYRLEYPEIDDAYAQEQGYGSAEEYYAAVRMELEENAQESTDEIYREDLDAALMGNTDVLSYPEDRLSELKEGYAETMGDDAEEYAKNELKSDLVYELLGETFGITGYGDDGFYEGDDGELVGTTLKDAVLKYLAEIQ